ncbi:hypothetical protein scyTo_0007531 [Scyliorhinus torazame]|uniref:RNase H type-1 domain-containing protein n=1 Tax=Scyliorhinus torazame TaxID=75743 RepID=A0A401NU55_SCYTO|nr:hypothetical protein [Scyliorhinus torazame]
MFTCNSCTEYMAIWSLRRYTSSDGNPLTTKPLLEKIVAAIGEGGDRYIHKVKAHSKTEPRAEGNQRADQFAKEGARTSVTWDPYEEGQVAAVRGQPEEKRSTGVVLAPDLGTVQAQDPILKATLTAIPRQEKVECPYRAADVAVKEGMLFKGDKW